MSFYRKIDPGIVSARAIRKTFDIAGLLDQDAATDPRALPSGNITDITDSTQQNNSDMAPKTSASAVKPPTTAASVAGAVKDGSETPVTSKIGVRRPINSTSHPFLTSWLLIKAPRAHS